MSDKLQDARVVEQTQNQATNANTNTNVQSQTYVENTVIFCFVIS